MPVPLAELLAGPNLEGRIKIAISKAKHAGLIDMSLMLCGGVYILENEDGILYVGETHCFCQRISSHLMDRRIPFSSVRVIWEDDANKRLELETMLIAKFSPPHNRRDQGPKNKNFNNVFRKPGYQSALDKSNLIDTEFDE